VVVMLDALGFIERWHMTKGTYGLLFLTAESASIVAGEAIRWPGLRGIEARWRGLTGYLIFPTTGARFVFFSDLDGDRWKGYRFDTVWTDSRVAFGLAEQFRTRCLPFPCR
jgi:hypothetical protein